MLCVKLIQILNFKSVVRGENVCWGGFYREGPYMKVLSSFALIIVVSLLSSLAFSAQTKKVLLVSDVDDTIKISHVLSDPGKISQAPNVTAVFTGMSQLYNLIQWQYGAKVIYLSNAPDGYDGISPIRFLHQTFLEYNKFPAGELLLRQELADQNHKITQLRRLLAEEKPDLMILFGDNGEKDSEVYHQFTEESKNKGVQVVSFIHQLYSSKQKMILSRIFEGHLFAEVGKKIFAEQVGYVTPVEVALELHQKGLLSESSTKWMVDRIAPYIVNQPRWKLSPIGEATFPDFEDCSDFVWRWETFSEITPLMNRINQECR